MKWIKGRFKSFGYALRGIKRLIASQQNARIHLVISIAVILLGFFLKISKQDWCLIVLAMMIVWVAEGLNTAIEFLSDTVSEKYHPLIEKAKDIAAGAVLLAALSAAVIGVLVFVSY